MKPYPSYKPSGVPWLGDMPAHWSIEKLKFFVRFVGGGTPSKDNDEYWGGDIPWVSPKDMKRPKIDDTEDKITEDAVCSSACTMIATGAVLVVVRSGILQHTIPIAINDVPVAVNQDMKALIPDERVQSSFLAYQIQGCQRELREYWVKQGATVESVEQQRMADSRFAIPPLDEQDAIASYLDRETARIDTLMREKEGLMGLLREMIAGETTRVMTEGLSPSVELKQTSQPWFKYILAHWELVQIRHVLGSGRGSMRAGPFGSQMTSNDMVDSGVKVYAQRHVIDNDFAQGENFVSKKKADEMTAFFVQPGDVLFTTRGTIGRCAVVPDGAEMGVLHPCLIRVRFDESRIRNDFVQYLVNSTEFFGRQLREKSNATTIEVVYTDNLRAVAFPLPPLDEQKAIVEHLDRETARIDKLVDHVQDEIKLLQELRAATITDAVTGKIQVL